MVSKVFFLSGVPRSGSTVLASLLNQNSEITVTQTSPVLDTLQLLSSAWPRLSANVLDQDNAQIKNVLHGAFFNAYLHLQTPIVIDKHRGWPRNIDYINLISGTTPKIICTTRDISEIIASFIMLIDKQDTISYIDKELLSTNKPINTATRSRLLWEKYISVPWTSLKIGWEKNPESICFVDYNEITNSPHDTIKKIYKFLDISGHAEHTITNLQSMHENDAAWGLEKLHHVRPVLRRTSPAASDILGTELATYYNNLKLEFWK